MEFVNISQCIVNVPVNIKASFVAGEGIEPIIRRFNGDPDVIGCYHGLVARLSQFFPGLTQDNFTVKWIDEDGDPITISSDEDVTVALRSIPPGKNLNIVIRDAGRSGVRHPGVICDVCNQGIYGHRYKCLTCSDYDLCSMCERNGAHPQHSMLRITTPRTQQNIFDECYGSFLRPGYRCRRGPTRCGPWGPTCPGASSSPCGKRSQSCQDKAFPAAEMNAMAVNIMKNWSEAMRQKADDNQKDGAKKDGAAPSEKGENVGEADREKNDDEKVDDDHFSAMLEEICQGLAETLGTFRGKRQHESDCNKVETSNDEGCSSKRSRGASEDEPKGDTKNVPFDFTEMHKTLAPMAQRFLEELTGPSKESQGGKEESEEEKARGDASKNEPQKAEDNPMPHLVDSLRQGAPQMFQMLTDVFGQMAPQTHEEDRASNNAGATGTTDGASAGPGPKTTPTAGSSAGTNNSKQSNFWQGIKDSYEKMVLERSMEGENSDENTRARVARSLEQLKSMGFTDENGWLTRLVEAKKGDLTQVLDAILPPRQ